MDGFMEGPTHQPTDLPTDTTSYRDSSKIDFAVALLCSIFFSTDHVLFGKKDERAGRAEKRRSDLVTVHVLYSIAKIMGSSKKVSDKSDEKRRKNEDDFTERQKLTHMTTTKSTPSHDISIRLRVIKKKCSKGILESCRLPGVKRIIGERTISVQVFKTFGDHQNHGN